MTMSDEQNKPLVDLIVGKAVKDAEGQRYVREAGRDVVYVIEIDPVEALDRTSKTGSRRTCSSSTPGTCSRSSQGLFGRAARRDDARTAGRRFGVAWDPRAEMTLGVQRRGCEVERR